MASSYRRAKRHSAEHGNNSTNQCNSKLLFCIGIIEKKVETTIVYWDYVGIMEKKMETIEIKRDYIGAVFVHSSLPRMHKG